MNWLMTVLDRWAGLQPDKTALCGGEVTLSYGDLRRQIEALTHWLNNQKTDRLALLLDNCPAWALIDIACMNAGKTLIPIPAFFSPAQIAGLLADADVELLLTDQPDRILALTTQGDDPPEWAVTDTRRVADNHINCLTRSSAAGLSELRQPLPEGTAKITYTSGSTGDPKGVCLTSESLRQVATELTTAMKVDTGYHHLCLLPLAVLLENVAGLYVALFAGATCRLESLGKLGWHGMTDFDFSRLAGIMLDEPVESLILVPELLVGLLALAEQQPNAVKSLRLVAVGGAAVPASQLASALEMGLPVYQGYGLSECGSVVTVNRPEQNRPGSVGKPLPHHRVMITDDHQIWIDHQGVNPYLGLKQPVNDGWWATGDRGHFDADGYLYIEGRHDNLLMTSFGRNVSPEWIELLLVDQPVIQQAVVLGGGQRQLEALLIIATECRDEQIDQALNQVNQQLPDYAQIGHWRRSDQRLTLTNRRLTRGGVPNRAAVTEFYNGLPDPECSINSTV